MASINMESIMAKAQANMGSNAGQAKVNNMVTKVMLGSITLKSGGKTHTPEEAAEKFIDVLRNSISSSGISSDAASAISELSHSSAVPVGANTYTIEIFFTGDLSRPSLAPGRFGGINNLAALLNNGVDHTMRPVHGMWHGHETWSRTVIPGAHFVDDAVSSFMGNYASEYNVIDISVGDAFS